MRHLRACVRVCVPASERACTREMRRLRAFHACVHACERAGGRASEEARHILQPVISTQYGMPHAIAWNIGTTGRTCIEQHGQRAT